MAPATIKDLATAATEVASRVLPLTNSPSSQNAPVQATEISQATTTDRMEAITPTTPTPTTARQDDAGGDAGTARGALIVLEGLDRSGKTTQVKLLEQRFVEVGRRVKVMRFPDRSTPIGQMIDAYLRSQAEMDDHVIHLLFSANRWEAAKSITSLLASGVSVLCDRYYYSGIVYSAAKRNPSLSLAWARHPEVGLPRPDIVLFLDLDEESARARGGWGGEVYEKVEMQKRVRDLFWGLSMGKLDLVKEEDGEGGKGVVVVEAPKPEEEAGVVKEVRFRQEEEDLVVVDAGGSVEDVAEEIWRVVRPRVEAVERGEVGREVRRVV